MRLTALCLALCLATPTFAQEALPSADDATALMNSGRFEEAAGAWKKRADADGNDAQAHFMYAYALHMGGDLDRAHDAHIQAAKFPQYTPTALYNHACVHALRNEKDAAFKALGEAVEAGFSNQGQLQGDGDMDNLRGDGRFEAILLRLGGTDASRLASLPAARRFDFYLGEWTMQKQGEPERFLSVSSAFDGQGLHVASTDLDGTAYAESLFLYDEKAGLWRQTWMSTGGLVVILEGALEGDAMVLRTVSENGQPATTGRSVFSNIDATGFVYQWQETSDGGASWETVSTRVFSRRAAS